MVKNMACPAKYELKKFLKFAQMIDFLKEKKRPFTAIAREAVNRGIFKQTEVNHFYHIFMVCVDCINLFDFRYCPEDQSPTGRAKYEWKLKDGVTQEIFIEKVNEYVKINFKTPLS